MTRRIEEAAAPVAAAAMILATTVVIALGAAGSSTLARAEDRPSASSDGAAQSAQVNPIGPQSVPFAAVGAVGAAGATAPSLPVKPIEGIDRAKATIVSVKSDPVFGSTSERHWWQYRPPMTHPDLNASWLTRFFQLFAPIIENIVEFFASAGRALLYVAGAILIVLVIVLVVLYSGGWASWKGRRSKAAPEMMFGLDVRPESLPDDVVAAAREALARGDFARALSLLYRGALVALIHRMHVEFRAGDTEENCATRIERVIDVPRFAYFRMLLDARLAIVYGHRVLPLGQLEALCDRWTENFGARTENAGTVR